MRRASYRAAIGWIALNDEPIERDPAVIAELISAVLVADIFGVEPERVGADVARLREQWRKRSAQAAAARRGLYL